MESLRNVTLISLPSKNFNTQLDIFNDNDYNYGQYISLKKKSNEDFQYKEIEQLTQIYKCLLAIKGYKCYLNEESEMMVSFEEQQVNRLSINLFTSLDDIALNPCELVKDYPSDGQYFKVKDKLTNFVNCVFGDNVKLEVNFYASENKIMFDNFFSKIKNIIDNSEDDCVYLDLMSGPPRIKDVLYPLGIFYKKCKCIEGLKENNLNETSNDNQLITDNYEYKYLCCDRSLVNDLEINLRNANINPRDNTLFEDINKELQNSDNIKDSEKLSKLFKLRTTLEVQGDLERFYDNKSIEYCIDNYNYLYLANISSKTPLEKLILNASMHNIDDSDENISFITFDILVKSKKYILAFNELENVLSTKLYNFIKNDIKIFKSAKNPSDKIIKQTNEIDAFINKLLSIDFIGHLDKDYSKQIQLFINNFKIDLTNLIDCLNKNYKKLALFHNYYLLNIYNVKGEVDGTKLNEISFYKFIASDLNDIKNTNFDLSVSSYDSEVINEIYSKFVELDDKNCDTLLEKYIYFYNFLNLASKVRNQITHEDSGITKIQSITDKTVKEIIKNYKQYYHEKVQKYLHKSKVIKWEEYTTVNLLEDIIEYLFKYYKKIDEYNIELKERYFNKDNQNISVEVADTKSTKNGKNALITCFTDKCCSFNGFYGPQFEDIRYCIENNIKLEDIYFLVTKEHNNINYDKVNRVIYDETKIKEELNKIYKCYNGKSSIPKIHKIDFTLDSYSIDKFYDKLYDIIMKVDDKSNKNVSKITYYDNIYLDCTSGMPDITVSLDLLANIDSKIKIFKCTDDTKKHFNFPFNGKINVPMAFKITENKISFNHSLLYSKIKEAIEKYEIIFLKSYIDFSLNIDKSCDNNLLSAYNEVKSSLDNLYNWYNYDYHDKFNGMKDRKKIKEKEIICYIVSISMLKKYNIKAFLFQCGIVIEKIVRHIIEDNKKEFICNKVKWKSTLYSIVADSKLTYTLQLNDIDNLYNLYDKRNSLIHKFTSTTKESNDEELVNNVINFFERFANKLDKQFYNEFKKDFEDEKKKLNKLLR